MTLANLYKQQAADKETFAALRDKTWAELRENHEQLAAAFGGKDRLPDDLRQRMDEELAAYRQEWSMHSGHRHKDMLTQHEEQIKSIVDKFPRKAEPHEQNHKDDHPLNDEKQEKMQRIIAQQQAIRKKQQEQKRGR